MAEAPDAGTQPTAIPFPYPTDMEPPPERPMTKEEEALALPGLDDKPDARSMPTVCC